MLLLLPMDAPVTESAHPCSQPPTLPDLPLGMLLALPLGSAEMLNSTIGLPAAVPGQEGDRDQCLSGGTLLPTETSCI